jgi:hypothetical protein
MYVTRLNKTNVSENSIYFLAISLDIPLTQTEKIKFDSSPPMNISFEESIPVEMTPSSPVIQLTLEDSSSSLSIEDKSDIPFEITDQPDELLCINMPRERTMSDASSDTVDYDFDTETCISLSLGSE